MVEKIAMHRPRRFVLAFSLVLAIPTSLSLLVMGCGETQRPDGGTGLLEAGADAPDLSTTAHDGTAIALRSLGKPAVVYFYPKDDTPGCTAEACAFRDIWTEYEKAGVIVIGVSTDDDASHREFAEKHELKFPLIADTDEAWAKAFGVSLSAGYADRVSFLLDGSGKIAKVYPGVDPGVHAREVLDDAAKL
jgi:peroxiredoxin Q/BCP